VDQKIRRAKAQDFLKLGFHQTAPSGALGTTMLDVEIYFEILAELFKFEYETKVLSTVLTVNQHFLRTCWFIAKVSPTVSILSHSADCDQHSQQQR
jgi:hypothetical protein